MSISSLTSIAAARESPPPPSFTLRVSRLTGLTESVTGFAAPSDGAGGAGATSGLVSTLVSQLPTELVAPYTVLSAAIVGAVASPTATNPNPDELSTYRWVAFGMLVAFVVLFVWVGSANKAGKQAWRYFPILAVTGSLVAAIGWAFILPSSPLTPYLHSQSAEILIPVFVGFGATALASLTAIRLSSPKPTKAPADGQTVPPPPEPGLEQPSLMPTSGKQDGGKNK